MESNIRIFIVDDDEFSLNMYGQYLRKSGFTNVELLNDGEKCHRRLNERPQLIFLDHMMDEISGMELLQKIRKWDPSIPVVIVSAQENIKTAVSFIKQGAYDYITKGDDELLRMKTISRKIAEQHGLQVSENHSAFDTSVIFSTLTMIVLLEIPLILLLNYFKIQFSVMLSSAILLFFLVCIASIIRYSGKGGDQEATT